MNCKHALFQKAKKIKFMGRMAHRFVKSTPLGCYSLFQILGGRGSVEKEHVFPKDPDSHQFTFLVGKLSSAAVLSSCCARRPGLTADGVDLLMVHKSVSPLVFLHVPLPLGFVLFLIVIV